MSLLLRFAIIALLCTAGLNADDFGHARELYRSGEYRSAFELFEKEALQENKNAQYRLAQMYEQGLGTEQNATAAMQWYKAAASLYAGDALETLAVEENASVPGDDAERRMHRFLLGKYKDSDADARSFIERYLNSDFGLYAYRTNYFLPYSKASSKYPRWSETGIDPQTREYDKRYEAEFQMSVKKPISFDLLGLNEAIVFAYTQKVWWQLYANSAPFRETNYEPEIFITFPTPESVDSQSGLKGVRVGYVHESNGRGGLQSRSWNRLYLATLWQHGNLFTALRAWYRLPEERKRYPLDPDGDDNPDITDYLGYGDLSFSYIYGQHQFDLMLRNNLHINGENRGAITLDWSYPLPYTEHSFWYVKLFSGYGESLIDYNRYVNKFAFGLSFSRGLF